MNHNVKTISIKGLVIWTIAMLFYFFECFTRVFPNTLSTNLIGGLHINAEQYSLINSAFFVIYAFMQIPVGYLINRLGVRIATTFACIVTSIGLIWFSLANSLSTAILTRLLMGFGASFGYIAVLLLALNWFPRRHFGFFTGLSQLLGSIGPILAGAPLAFLLNATHDNWRLILLSIGFLGLFIALLIGLLVQNKPKTSSHIIHLQLTKKATPFLKEVLTNGRLCLLILYTACVYTPIPIIGTFWGVLYLQTRQFTKPQAALLTSLIWIGYALGSPLIGKLSDQTHRRLPWMRLTALLGIASSTLLIFYPTQSQTLLALFFICIGLAATGQSLGVATISENVSHSLQTTFMGITNSILMFFGALIPAISGALIHTSQHSANTYTPLDFTRGLSLMPLLFTLTFLISLFGIKETFCRPQEQIIHLKRNK